MRIKLLGFGNKKARPGSGVYRAGADRPVGQHRHRRLQAAVVVCAFAVLVGALTHRLTPDDEVIDFDLDAQKVAETNFIAEFPFESRDLNATRQAMDEAEKAVPDAYRVEAALVQDRLNAFEARIAGLREATPELQRRLESALLASTSQVNEQAVLDATVTAVVQELIAADADLAELENAAALVLWLTPALESLPTREFEAVSEGTDPATVARAVTGLTQPDSEGLKFAHLDQLAALSHNVLDSMLSYGLLQPDPREGTQVGEPDRVVEIFRDRTVDDQAPLQKLPFNQVPTMNAAGPRFAARIAQWMEARAGDEATQIPLDLETIQKTSLALTSPFLTNTLRFDRGHTLAAREAARAEVELSPVMKPLERGLKLQGTGERWTEQSKEDVRTYLALTQDEGHQTSIVAGIIANMIFVGLVLGCLVWCVPLLASRDAFLSLWLVLLTVCGTLVLGRVVSYFEPTGYVVPLAAGPILLAILLNGRIAAITSFLAAVLLSIQYNFSWPLLMVCTAMSLTGVFSIFVVRRRSDIGRAVFRATFVGLILMLAVTLTTETIISESAFRNLLYIGFNGIACLFLVPGLLPPLERVTGITTDIQMLEYSDLNNEVLGRLAIEVPATYAHSLMLGQLAEAAADAIGANGLQARVCAYYHDIGKLHRPEYFSENQSGQNIHEGLTPRLSARAIAAHVTRGAEMAREFHLPKPIIDAILEHHGTNLISFFYDEALKQQKHGDVEESDFRYPGPKPQSPETAILMICDGVESGIRSIKNPNEERIREFIDRIITSRAEDDQFSECDVTLKDLDTIRDVVTSRMLSSMHRRIAYPDQGDARQKANVIPLSGGSDS
jgi:putative nucleotidyltransferase with HDIG domain